MEGIRRATHAVALLTFIYFFYDGGPLGVFNALLGGTIGALTVYALSKLGVWVAQGFMKDKGGS